jgi:arginyl-tRNA synthetase
VHHVARYLERLAGTYHRFYDACRILHRGEQPATDLARARIFLAEATRIVLTTA